MAKKKSINVTVLVNETHKDNLADLAKDLKGKGFVLKESLEAVGVLTGSVPAASVAALSAVPGVSAVEEEQTDYRTQKG
jgi:hypothetical protein